MLTRTDDDTAKVRLTVVDTHPTDKYNAREVIDVCPTAAISFSGEVPPPADLENLEEVLEKQEIARLVGVSTRHMERLFRKYLQTTPNRYYFGLRMGKARTLVTRTDLNLYEVREFDHGKENFFALMEAPMWGGKAKKIVVNFQSWLAVCESKANVEYIRDSVSEAFRQEQIREISVKPLNQMCDKRLGDLKVEDEIPT